MHDRAERLIGAVTSATAMPNEIMILLTIDCLIAQLRPPVETRRSTRIRFGKNAADARLRGMKLPARILFALLAVSLASLTPVLPGEPVPPVQQKMCCADMNMN